MGDITRHMPLPVELEVRQEHTAHARAKTLQTPTGQAFRGHDAGHRWTSMVHELDVITSWTFSRNPANQPLRMRVAAIRRYWNGL